MASTTFRRPVLGPPRGALSACLTGAASGLALLGMPRRESLLLATFHHQGPLLATPLVDISRLPLLLLLLLLVAVRNLSSSPSLRFEWYENPRVENGKMGEESNRRALRSSDRAIRHLPRHLSSSKHPDTPYLESSCSLFPLLRESKTLRGVSRQIAKMEDPRRRRTEEEKNRELAAAVANLSIHSTAMDPLISKEALEGLLDYLKRKGWALDER